MASRWRAARPGPWPGCACPLLAGADAVLPTAARLAAFIDARAAPAWIAAPDGTPAFANRAWLEAAGAESLSVARDKGLTFDRAADDLAREAARASERREAVRWAAAGGRRRAFRLTAEPLEGGGVGVWSEDVTEAEEAGETLRRHAEAQDQTLNQIREGVAIFGADRRMQFNNAAFAELWGLEPAWLAERPSHGELLDRLRQRRRLPETADYGKWKAAELAAYEALAPAEDLWRLPDARTLRVVRQPHPWGGLLLLFSDITDELKLKAEFNALIQVQQATLDKLTDAVAVFSSDGRLKLHNEAFERFWNVTGAQLAAAPDFEGVVELCLPRLHDRQFWRDLKARVADPDPKARAPVTDEVITADKRIVAFQSRPLPDGATLIGFSDVTDTRRLEGALRDREAALAEAERLKRDFVGNVSYELRTPLTTIIGYSELLEHSGEALSDRLRGHVAAVRAAATQLARSIDDVLDIAQIDANEMAVDLEDVDVSRLLEAAANRWAAGRRRPKQGLLSVAAGADVGLIRGDSRRLGQMLDHLIENGLRQTPADGLVTLAAERGGGEVRLIVSDTGRGIPFHVQAHIFDRFVGRDQGGPGLGLALVKALVELHGGWVALESEPGAGSTFTCHLPEAAQAGGGAGAVLEAALRPPSAPRLRAPRGPRPLRYTDGGCQPDVERVFRTAQRSVAGAVAGGPRSRSPAGRRAAPARGEGNGRLVLTLRHAHDEAFEGVADLDLAGRGAEFGSDVFGEVEHRLLHRRLGCRSCRRQASST